MRLNEFATTSAIQRQARVLLEGRDAPLFHATSIVGALGIVASDAIGLDANGTVSLSRSYQKAAAVAREGDDAGATSSMTDEGDIAILVLDQRRLAQRYRIRPFHDQDWEQSSSYAADSGMHDEQEEVVRGIIRPLAPFLVSLNMPDRRVEELLNAVRLPGHYIEAFGSNEAARRAIRAVAAHPKLNRWLPRSGKADGRPTLRLRAGSMVRTRECWLYVGSVAGGNADVFLFSPRQGWVGPMTFFTSGIVAVTPAPDDTPPPPPPAQDAS